MKIRKSKLLLFVYILLILAVLQSLPVFMLKPLGAKELRGEKVVVFYESGDEKGAKEIFNSLERRADEIRDKLEFENSQLTEVYVYSSQKSLWIRKYGFVTLLGAPKWYIGDNKGDKVLIISPYEKVKGHSRESILGAATHELVHTINYQINPKLSYWNDNGVATYLSYQSPNDEDIKDSSIPTLQDMRSENQKRFGEIGGYGFSYTYIDFLSKEYSWDKVIDLVKGEKSYTEIFSKSEEEIYNQWVEFLKSKYK